MIILFFRNPAYSALKGTVVIWTGWLVKDGGVRQTYRTSVNTATAKILRDIDEDHLSYIDDANEAVDKRNTLLLKMRAISSPVGLLIARQIKHAGGTVEAYLNRNARKSYDLNYDEITQYAQRKQVGFKLQKLRIHRSQLPFSYQLRLWRVQGERTHE